MKKNIVYGLLVMAFCGVGAAFAAGGTTVVGDEAREVFNTLIAAGATRTEIPEGPTVIIDQVDCSAQMSAGAISQASCKLAGDPKLSHLDGAMAIRFTKGLLAMGVRQKSAGGDLININLSGLDCGILHLPNSATASRVLEDKGEASCFFSDNN